MSNKLTVKEKEWYYNAIKQLGGTAVTVDSTAETVTYNSAINSDESHVKSADAEELAHAVTIGLLTSSEYKYPLTAVGHELHFAHGSKGSKSDEVDILIRDSDGLPYALLELKSAKDFHSGRTDAIKNQLFGTATLVGSPKLLIYATVEPAALLKSIIRSLMNGPRSLMRTMTDFPVLGEWAHNLVPNGSVGCAAVRAFILNRSPLAVRLF